MRINKTLMSAVSGMAAAALSMSSLAAPARAGNTLLGRRPAVAEEEKPKDPYHGIKSRGRTGAHARHRKMEAVLTTLPIGKRLGAVSGSRRESNPFKDPAKAKRYVAEILALAPIVKNPAARRQQAMKNVRRAG